MVKFFDKAKVDFIVKEEEGVVVAKFAKPREVASNLQSLAAPKFALLYFDNYDKLFRRISNVRGIAKCAPEDKFDVKIGKRIALSKLKRKSTISFAKYVEYLRNRLFYFLEKYDHLLQGSFLYANELDSRLNTIYNTVETKN